MRTSSFSPPIPVAPVCFESCPGSSATTIFPDLLLLAMLRTSSEIADATETELVVDEISVFSSAFSSASSISCTDSFGFSELICTTVAP